MKKAREIKINGRSMIVVREGERTFVAYDKHNGEKIAEFLKNSLEEYPLMRIMRMPRLVFNATYRPIEDEVELEYRLIAKRSRIFSPSVVDKMEKIENVFFGINSVINLMLLKEKAIDLIKML